MNVYIVMNNQIKTLFNTIEYRYEPVYLKLDIGYFLQNMSSVLANIHVELPKKEEDDTKQDSSNLTSDITPVPVKEDNDNNNEGKSSKPPQTNSNTNSTTFNNQDYSTRSPSSTASSNVNKSQTENQAQPHDTILQFSINITYNEPNDGSNPEFKYTMNNNNNNNANSDNKYTFNYDNNKLELTNESNKTNLTTFINDNKDKIKTIHITYRPNYKSLELQFMIDNPPTDKSNLESKTPTSTQSSKTGAPPLIKHKTKNSDTSQPVKN